MVPSVCPEANGQNIVQLPLQRLFTLIAHSKLGACKHTNAKVVSQRIKSESLGLRRRQRYLLSALDHVNVQPLLRTAGVPGLRENNRCVILETNFTPFRNSQVIYFSIVSLARECYFWIFNIQQLKKFLELEGYRALNNVQFQKSTHRLFSNDRQGFTGC